MMPLSNWLGMGARRIGALTAMSSEVEGEPIPNWFILLEFSVYKKNLGILSYVE